MPPLYKRPPRHVYTLQWTEDGQMPSLGLAAAGDYQTSSRRTLPIGHPRGLTGSASMAGFSLE
jgi:hypothetical protein